MFASFHYGGTIPSSSDNLNTFASGVLIFSALSLSSFGGITSTPGDLLCFILLIFFAIISGVTYNCFKCSDLSPSNLVTGTGSEMISYVVKTKLKYSFKTSAVRNPSEIMFPLLFCSGPTLSRTFYLLLT